MTLSSKYWSFAAALLLSSTIAAADAVLIDRVTVDKSTVCPGEDVLVTVDTVAGALDPIVRILGEAGHRRVVSFAASGSYHVPVVVLAGADTQFGHATVEVSACPAPAASVALRQPVQGTDDDTVVFEAVASGVGPAAVTYQWDFGDGVQATTTKSGVRHSYALRTQTRPESNFLVSVAVLDASSQVLATARTTATLANRERAAPTDTLRSLPLEYDRVPKRTAERIATFVTMRNPLNVPVRLEEITLRGALCADESVHEVGATADVFFGAPVDLAAASSWRGAFSVRKDAFPSAVCKLSALLSAASGGQTVMRGSLELDLGIPVGKGEMITDPVLIERVRQAQDYLRKEVVTANDLAEVEKLTAPNRPPRANAGGPYSTHLLGLTFDASQSADVDGSIARYDWAFGDGTTASGVTATHTYAAAGEYTVLLRVTDNAGAEASAVVRAVTGASRPPTVAVQTSVDCSTPQAPCKLTFLADAADPDGDTLQYLWRGCATGAGSSSTCVGSSAGLLHAVVDVSDGHGQTASAIGGVTLHAAGYATSDWLPFPCPSTGVQTRTIVEQSWTFDPALVAVAPPITRSCTPPPPLPQAQVLVNGSAAPISVPAGSTITVSVSGGPATATDWVARAAQGAPNEQFLDWSYLNGAKTVPTSGVAAATLSFVMPNSAGTYELRFFRENGFSLLAKSAAITVLAPAGPVVQVNGGSAPITVTPGAMVTITISGSPGQPTDWVAKYAAGAPDASFHSDWRYLNDSKTPPTSGLSAATLTFAMPAAAGTYEIRFLRENGFSLLAKSPTITVVPDAVPTVRVNGSSTPITVARNATIVVTVSGLQQGNALDWMTKHAASAGNTSFLEWKYLNGTTTAPASGSTSATLTFTAPASAGTYDFRLFHNNGYTLLAKSPVVTVP